MEAGVANDFGVTVANWGTGGEFGLSMCNRLGRDVFFNP